MIVFSLVCFGLSVSLRFLIGRRRFNRRNANGIEGFSSYSNALLTKFGERLLSILSRLLMVFAILLFVVWYLLYVHNK